MFVCIYLRGTVLMTTTSLNDRSRRNITTPPSQAKHPPLQWLSIVPLNTCNSECYWIIAATTTAMATTSFLRWFLSLLIIYPIHITLYICSYAILNIHLCVATYNPMCLWYKRLYAFSFHFICPHAPIRLLHRFVCPMVYMRLTRNWQLFIIVAYNTHIHLNSHDFKSHYAFFTTLF